MKRSLTSLWAVAACAAVLSTGCSDAASTGDPLNAADAEDLAAELIELGFSDAGFGGFHMTNPNGIPGAPAAPNEEITITVTQTHSCEGSGTVALAGKVTANSNTAGTSGSVVFDYSVTPTNCRITTESAKQYTVNGDPNLKVSGRLDLTGTQTTATVRGTLNYNGGFRWESSEGTAGGCKFEVQVVYDFTITQTSASGSATVQGKVCGITVNRTESGSIS